MVQATVKTLQLSFIGQLLYYIKYREVPSQTFQAEIAELSKENLAICLVHLNIKTYVKILQLNQQKNIDKLI